MDKTRMDTTTTCTGDCNQGRNCTCRKGELMSDKLEVAMWVMAISSVIDTTINIIKAL
jgi:hypothetical protein